MTDSNTAKGALPEQMISQLVDSGNIKNSKEGNIKPASLDLSLSSDIYKLQGVFLPHPGETVREVLDKVEREAFDLNRPLEVDSMYLVKLNEELELPQDVYAYCNPKSSTGRLDLHVRLMADGVARYDAVTPKGFKGELWALIIPKSFNVLLHEGISLNQLRFFNKDTRFDEEEVAAEMKKYKFFWSIKDNEPIEYERLKIKDGDGSLIMRIDIDSDVIGYEAIKTNKILDASKIGEYDMNDFFTPVRKDEYGNVRLQQGKFYILSTKEKLRVPPELACEMAPMDERSGEFRSHYAGFIDPGWGWGKDGEGTGRPITLEVRPFEDMIVRHNQSIGKIKFERMIEVPDSQYDEIGSNYLIQEGPKLAKQFKKI